MAKKLLKMPTTSYAVLGLLSFGEELSGYDIRQWAQGMRFFYWSPAQSQVYGELRRLANNHLVSARDVPQTGKPDKRLYRITEDGIAEFRRWWSSDELDRTTVIKHSVALKIYFGHMGEKTHLISLLEDFIEDVKENLSQLGIVQAYFEDDEQMAYPAIAAEWSYHYHKAELEMAQSLLARFKDEN